RGRQKRLWRCSESEHRCRCETLRNFLTSTKASQNSRSGKRLPLPAIKESEKAERWMYGAPSFYLTMRSVAESSAQNKSAAVFPLPIALALCPLLYWAAAVFDSGFANFELSSGALSCTLITRMVALV